MKNILENQRIKILTCISNSLFVLVISIYILFLFLNRIALSDFLLFISVIIIYFLFPGLIFIKKLGFKIENPFSKLLVSFPLSIFITFLLYLVSIRIGNPVIIRIFSLFILITFVLIYKQSIYSFRFNFNASTAYLQIFISLGLLLIYPRIFQNTNIEVSDYIHYSQDIAWNIGNLTASKFNFPPLDIHVGVVEFKYHYLSTLFMGMIAYITNINSYVLLLYFYLPFVGLLLFASYFIFANSFFNQNIRLVFLAFFVTFLTNSLEPFIWGTNNSYSYNYFYHAYTLDLNSVALYLSLLFIFLIIQDMFFKADSVRSFYMVMITSVFLFVSILVAKSIIALLLLCALISLNVIKYKNKNYLIQILLFIFVFIPIYIYLFGGNKSIESTVDLSFFKSIKETKFFIDYSVGRNSFFVSIFYLVLVLPIQVIFFFSILIKKNISVFQLPTLDLFLIIIGYIKINFRVK